MRSCLRPILLLLLLGAMPSAASAGSAGTLDRLTDGFDARLGAALEGRQAASIDLGLAVRTLGAAPPRLGAVIQGLVLARLRARGLRSVQLVPADLEQAARRRWAGERGLELLLVLDVMITGGHLHLTGGLRSCERNLWRDALHARPGLLHHLHASTRMDAEVRAYQGALTTDRLRLSLAAHALAGGTALALGAGDLDGDGRAELVVLHPLEVRVLRHRGRNKGLDLVARAALQGAPAPMRPRRPMGALLVADLDGDGKAEVLLRSSELARGSVLALADRVLVSRRELEGYPLAVRKGGVILTCPARPGQDLLDGAKVTLTGAAAGAPKPGGLSPSLYAFHEASVPRKGAPPMTYRGALDSAGRFQLEIPGSGDKATLATLPRAGVAFHLADLTDDGTLEVITSGAGGPREEDRIEIRRLEGGKLSSPVWSSAGLRGVVTALTHGDLDGDGKLELLGALLGRDGAARLVVLR